MKQSKQLLKIQLAFTQEEREALRIHKKYPSVMKDSDITDELTQKLIEEGLLIKSNSLYYYTLILNPLIEKYF